MRIEDKVRSNPLCTRGDVADLLIDLCQPLKERFSAGKAYLKIGNTGAHYGEKSIGMEGFARVLWGIGPFLAGGKEGLDEKQCREFDFWSELSRKGICHGTDEEHEEYWGDIYDYDQKMVETAALVTALALAKAELWDACSDAEKENISRWLYQINDHEVHKNNWRFFRILVNTVLEKLGMPYDNGHLEEDLAVIESCYQSKGWYFDGSDTQLDYYIPFAMHYYGLLYAHLREEQDRERAEEFRARAEKFAEDFVYFFAENGAEIPFGRSLTYRFAHSAFFSALLLDRKEAGAVSGGVAKHIMLQNLRYWMKQPIFDNAGILTIGYGYPNLFMSERYNAPGSPYWAFKTFLLLALPASHPVWQAQEEETAYDKIKLMEQPHMLITHDDNNHVQAFVAGQHCMNYGNSAAKYEKFVYSNQFGFSVSRGNTLVDGAFDNTLAASLAGDDFYRMRFGVSEYRVTEQYTYIKYQLLPGMEVESYIVPLAVWHVRIHKIKTAYAADIADGGFALSIEAAYSITKGKGSGKWQPDMVKKTDRGLTAQFPWGTSGVAGDEKGGYELVAAYPNTNLFVNVAVIPTYTRHLEPGEHLVVTAMFADRSNQAKEWADNPPETILDGNRVMIRYCSFPKSKGNRDSISFCL